MAVDAGISNNSPFYLHLRDKLLQYLRADEQRTYLSDLTESALYTAEEIKALYEGNHNW